MKKTKKKKSKPLIDNEWGATILPWTLARKFLHTTNTTAPAATTGRPRQRALLTTLPFIPITKSPTAETWCTQTISVMNTPSSPRICGYKQTSNLPDPNSYVTPCPSFDTDTDTDNPAPSICIRLIRFAYQQHVPKNSWISQPPICFNPVTMNTLTRTIPPVHPYSRQWLDIIAISNTLKRSDKTVTTSSVISDLSLSDICLIFTFPYCNLDSIFIHLYLWLIQPYCFCYFTEVNFDT